MMPDIDSILKELHRQARSGSLEGMARFGISTRGRLGVRVPDIRALAKTLKRDTNLAQQLWNTGVAEARILASMVADPNDMSSDRMDEWVGDLDSWDVCDQLCMNCFDQTPHAWDKVRAWAAREEEYAKRAAFALLACLAWHDKRTPDVRFRSFLPLIDIHASDPRNYVKKAVSWALRHIGKRNPTLRVEAMQLAEALSTSNDRTRRWIGKDAIRDLTSTSTMRRMRRLKSEKGD